MRKILVYVSTDKIRSRCEKTIEVEDDCTDAEIDEFARDAMFSLIEWNWRDAE